MPQEVRRGEHGGGKDAVAEFRQESQFGEEAQFGQETQLDLRYDDLGLFDYRDARPLSPSLSPSPRSRSLAPFSRGGKRCSLLLVVAMLVLLLVVLVLLLVDVVGVLVLLLVDVLVVVAL